MTEVRPRRSVLSMPGSNARALEKALGLPCDVVMIDLEDAVAADAKARARDSVAAAVAAKGFGRREVVVRINPLDGDHGEDDLAAVCPAGPDAILVPKVSGADALVAVGSRLRRLKAPAQTRIWAMIESPLAILNLADIASAARDVDVRLACLVVGPNDLIKAGRLRPVPGRAPLMPWLMSAVAAARAYEIDVIDGIYNAFDDAEGFAAECAQGRECGFDGKMLIHPSQIAPANAAFGPAPDEVAEAEALIAVFADPENRGRGALPFRGRMVERLHAEEARRVLGLADAIAQLQGAVRA